MTVRLLVKHKQYPIGSIVTLDAGTEAGLVAAKLADTNLAGGVAYVAPTVPNQRYSAQVEVDSASGAVTGIVNPKTGDTLPLGSGGADLIVTGTQAVGAVLTGAYTKGGGTIMFTRTPVAGGATVDIGSAVPSGSTYTVQVSDRGYAIGARAVTYLPPVAPGLAIPTVAPLAPSINNITPGTNNVTVAFTRNADNGGDTVIGDLVKVYAAGSEVPFAMQNGTSPITVGGLPVQDVYARAATVGQTNGVGPLSAPSVTVKPLAPGATVTNADVVVYGGSWPAVCAAIRAKQQGRSVMLIMSRDVVGGMVRSGIQLTDSSTYPNMWRATIPESSLSNQLYAALASTYGIGQQAFYRDYSYASESKTTGTVIDSLLATAGITPVTNQELLSITKSGTDIDTATFSGVGTVRAKQWIEASYTGDLLAKSGADYFMGGEAASTYSESAQQAGFVIAGGQPASNVDPYVTPGNSSSGLIKYVQNVSAVGMVGVAVPNKLQFPGYRLSITNTTGKKVAFPKPADAPANASDYATWPSYANYELHRRDATANKTGATTISSFLNLQTGFPAIPSKTSGMTAKRDANNGGVFSLDFPDVALITEYFTPGTSRARRLEIEDIAWQYTLGYLYFLQNDPAIPSAARTDIASYGFVNDDYLTTGGRPPLMYPRETIRAVGDAGTTLKAGDITAANNAVSNPCALAYYAFDKHSRQFAINTVGGVDRVVQEGGTPSAVTPSAPGARISATVLNPKKSQCSNLQVVTTPNASQMFYNSYRVEPLMAVAAEYAGIRAALAVATTTAVQDVPHASVAPIHNLYGLDPVGGTCATVDGTTRTQGSLTTQGTWGSSTTNIAGTVSLATCTAASGTNTFTYTPQVPASGNWKIQIKYLDSSPSGLTRGTFTTVATVGGVPQPSMTINQNSAAAGVTTNGDWQTVYNGPLAQGDTLVGTYNNSGNSGNIVAARIVPA